MSKKHKNTQKSINKSILITFCAYQASECNLIIDQTGRMAKKLKSTLWLLANLKWTEINF